MPALAVVLHIIAAAAASAATGSPYAQDRPPVVRDTLAFGDRRVAAGDTLRGPVVVVGGDLRVSGIVLGTAVVALGDIVVEPGGAITGDAISILGEIEAPVGAIGGASRTLDIGNRSLRSGTSRGGERRTSTASALQVALGWLLVTLAVGICVLVLAGSYLEAVSDVVVASFWRSFFTGLLAEIALLPAMIVMVVLLAVTIVGILLIPFALVAYVVAVAGLLALGFLAVARATGAAFATERVRLLSPRGQALRGMVVGISFYIGLWVLAAALRWVPLVSLVLQALAGAVTYVALTAGLGAAVLSRAGTRRDLATPAEVEEPLASWQTPTPVTGVVAARRPAGASGD
ncbi:MAG TPA: hypothetical protein VNL96_09110 [Gemmatimonadaceae bacterium]|nr:hypothetical protein [Gemmatimonadaceae bacterium]